MVFNASFSVLYAVTKFPGLTRVVPPTTERRIAASETVLLLSPVALNVFALHLDT